MPNVATNVTIDRRAEVSDDVEIGPGCYIGPDVSVGPGCRLGPNVTILGNTQIGRGNVFHPSAVIGAPPQDLKYEGTKTRLIIGDDNVFREGVTAHTGTEVGGGVTEIGNCNQFQVGTHLAHDVKVGSHCILSNQVQVAGHVCINDHVTISGLVGVQQFVTVGQYAFITGMARCTWDVPPYLIYGFEGEIQGVNVKGLSRWGFDEPSVQKLRELYKQLFPRKNRPTNTYRLRTLYGLLPPRRDDRNGAVTLARRLREVESNGTMNQHCQFLIDFLKRSVHDGVYGRYLESRRRDNSATTPRFYNGGNDR